MTHTPGPWIVTLTLTDGRPCIQALGNDHCFDVAYAAPMHEAGKDKSALEAANASLIAAAPDLLAALEACVCAMQDYQAGIGITEMFDKGERMGRAAIAQAKGDA